MPFKQTENDLEKSFFFILRFIHKLLESTFKLHSMVRCIQFFEASKEPSKSSSGTVMGRKGDATSD